jgi:DnaJ-class molecular chaperone
METNETEIQKPCGYCAGTGKASGGKFGDETITCPVCQGSAIVKVPADSVLHITCDASGKIRFRRGGVGKQDVLCPDCHGTGWFSQSNLTQ